VACSGERNVNYNVACCHSPDPDALVVDCLQPLLELGKPAIAMLAGPGLATAQKLVEIGWVVVQALPLMILTDRPPVDRGADPDRGEVRALTLDELDRARDVLRRTYGLDRASAVAAVPDRAVEEPDLGVWGLFEDGALVSCFTGADQEGLLVVWSMATPPEHQGHGYGRHLLGTVLHRHLDAGGRGSLLQSSVAGHPLYRALGYTDVEHWQLWSRPRWVMAMA
jgi:GNAT superfamily N-acetyltransferase